MLFTSYSFIGFAVFILFAYYLLPKKCQWMLLLLASYIFYFIAGPEYIIYIVVTTVTTYFSACRIEKNANRQSEYLKSAGKELSKEEKKLYKEKQKHIRSRWKIAGILINIIILATVKYSNFLISNVNDILGAFGGTEKLSFVTMILPLGISFYTFQAIGYLIDVCRGTVHAERNLFKYALFISFFPQLVQGPISRFGELSKTLYSKHNFNGKELCFGLQRILWGFFKKLVIADRILAGVSTIMGDVDTYNGAYAFVGMILYTLQLYADFTGGIDITIGIAQTFGIKIMENFNRPYFSKSLKEYWRRWHISMCSWFRDYIFYPVSSSRLMQKFTKVSRKYLGGTIGKHLPVYISSFVVWFSTGIWHGASWNFIVWGMANWFILMISEELEPVYLKFHNRFKMSKKFTYRLFQTGRTFLLICCLNLFDCYSSVADTLKALGSVFTADNWNVLWNGELLKIGLTMEDYFIILSGAVILLVVSIIQRSGSIRNKISKKPYPVKYIIWFGLFITVLLAGAYGAGYDSSQFIYNRF